MGAYYAIDSPSLTILLRMTAMMRKVEIKTDKAPKMPFSLPQGVRAGDLVFVNVAPIDINGAEIDDDFEKAARQIFENAKAVLEAGGSSMANIVRIDAYIRDYGNIDTFNRIYLEYVPAPYPVRSISQPARTPRDCMCAMVVTATVD